MNAPLDTVALAPSSADELAEALREAAAAGRTVVPWGAGTLQHLGGPPDPAALRLSTAGLSRVIEYNPADLTITAEAGLTLGAAQQLLGQHGQWLPWDPPTPERATIGGLLAAGASGPLRLGYGTPRDWALGMHVALGDGRLVKSGGKVVKNVAGYESHKLQIGALGTLGVIAEVTLRVAPLPERGATLVCACGSWADALALADRLRERPMAPVSLIAGPAEGRGVQVAARFAGVPAAVERQLDAARAAAAASGASIAIPSAEQAGALWRELALFPAPGGAARQHAPADPIELVIRAGVRPSALGAALDALGSSAPAGAAPRMIGYGGVGLAYARWRLAERTPAGEIAAAIGAARARLAGGGGYAVIEHAPGALRGLLDLWGPPPPTLAIMRALKAQWDPHSVLNRGRYAGGL